MQISPQKLRAIRVCFDFVLKRHKFHRCLGGAWCSAQARDVNCLRPLTGLGKSYHDVVKNATNGSDINCCLPSIHPWGGISGGVGRQPGVGHAQAQKSPAPAGPLCYHDAMMVGGFPVSSSTFSQNVTNCRYWSIASSMSSSAVW